MPYVSGRNGAVAAASPLAACEALKTLMNGGNAIDAAIVAAAVLSVDEPYFSGPGGHGIALVDDAASKDTRCLDFGGFAPHAFTIDQWGTPPAYPRGSVVSAIFPAMLAGWAELLAKYGTMSLADALEPAIKHAVQGVESCPIGAGASEEAFVVVPVLHRNYQNSTEADTLEEFWTPRIRANMWVSTRRCSAPGLQSPLAGRVLDSP